MVWNDAPSHVCRGGDVRGLAFCCPPVKPCPVMRALDEVNISPQDYIDIKNKFANETRLGEGPRTCFGSLVWCCKPSKPCPLRDMTLNQIDMSQDEYLQLKKELSEVLTGTNNTEQETSDESVSALAKSFDITESEASKILTDCNDDLRMALKVLKVKSLENE
ncbi:methanogenesis marker 9 domain-containing protein [Methanobrevibacter sp. DSM 116169]|uniref:methanogenesis marker 9 domain-containing protein n=1 Tax=Methanobrevibacter sp. DSM 116169 TaxID=3242727 RepID=UPI0038FCBB7C